MKIYENNQPIRDERAWIDHGPPSPHPPPNNQSLNHPLNQSTNQSITPPPQPKTPSKNQPNEQEVLHDRRRVYDLLMENDIDVPVHAYLSR